ncbi:MAG: DUF559 domain-containing protein [Chloroflexota bacterium]
MNKLGVHFRRQQVIQGFIVDFYCLPVKITRGLRQGGAGCGGRGGCPRFTLSVLRAASRSPKYDNNKSECGFKVHIVGVGGGWMGVE